MLVIRKLIPDRNVQNTIQAAIAKAIKEYEEGKTYPKTLAAYVAHMETFTETMKYLNEGMDLIKHDITGAMTDRAERMAKLPDKQKKPIHPEEEPGAPEPAPTPAAPEQEPPAATVPIDGHQLPP